MVCVSKLWLGKEYKKKRIHFCVVHKLQLISVNDSGDAGITSMPSDLLFVKWKNSTSFWYNTIYLLRISCPVWQLEGTLSCTHILRSHEGVALSPFLSPTNKRCCKFLVIKNIFRHLVNIIKWKKGCILVRVNQTHNKT